MRLNYAPADRCVCAACRAHFETLMEGKLMSPIANARMYSVCDSVAADWKTLLAWVLERAGLNFEVIDYPAPAPVSVLWARDDLGLVMMCGLPFAQRSIRPTLIAAPIPAPARYEGQAVYFTDIVVRADSSAQTLADTFGGVVGYTLAESMSGGVAFLNYLQPLREQRGERLYRDAVGELIHARGVIEAIDAGRVDVGPLDSYYHDLLKQHEPQLTAKVRTIATTVPMPIPPLIATADLSEDELQRLRSALLATATEPSIEALMERLLLKGFAIADPDDYEVIAEVAKKPFQTFEEI